MARVETVAGRDWRPVVDAVKSGERFVLTTHVRPDTDGVGSAIALHRYLVQAGKQARIINPGPLAENLAILDPDGAVEAYRDEHAAFVRDATVIVLDVSERERLGPLAGLLADHPGSSICIDHHINHERRFASINLIDPTASATGVLVFEMLQTLGHPIDEVCAQALYATIVADTGSFRFSNTTGEVLRVAADLVELGAAPQQVSRAVLGNYSRHKMRLLTSTLNAARSDCDERLAWSSLSAAALRDAGTTIAETDGLVEYLRLQREVRAALLFIELEAGEVKISFRSEDGVDVNQLAARWGGGGHRHASGAVVAGTLDDVIARVVATARELFDEGR